MQEAGTVPPAGWPSGQADPHVACFCQTLVVTLGGGVVLIRRLLENRTRRWLLGSMMLVVLGLGGRWLVSL